MVRAFSFFQILFKKPLFTVLGVLLCTACASTKNRTFEKNTHRILQSDALKNQFTGLTVVDASNGKILFDYNGQKYFTPASNVKIATLYTALQLLPSKIPSVRYIVQGDTLYMEGLGDPTQLHPYFKDSTVVQFLNSHKHIALNLSNFKGGRFGPGWAWDDYSYSYHPERSGLPLYGNVVTLLNQGTTKVMPSYFKDSVVAITFETNREEEKNRFYHSFDRKDTIAIPFKTSPLLTRTLLGELSGKTIGSITELLKGPEQLLYSVASDSVYKRMMVVSDNFLAEQLLILASATLSDTLDGRLAQDHLLANQLVDLEQPPRWVDGSGLSRYNLFSPRSLTQILQKLYVEIPKERLFTFFPVGGVSGTLENWYGGGEQPYIYAKSGSLGNNYCLSGYLLTRSGKTLIFSFMNNHFRQPTATVKQRMQLILESMRDTY